jgi:hypothetical protein
MITTSARPVLIRSNATTFRKVRHRIYKIFILQHAPMPPSILHELSHTTIGLTYPIVMILIVPEELNGEEACE